MSEPRAKGYCHYTQATYAMMGLLKNVCGQKSMRSMEENFNTENVLTALQIMSADASLQEIPCADSLNYYLSKLQPQELSNVRCKMIRHLIRSRTFDNFRFLEKYWPVVLDGTGVHAFSERHCEHDLVCRRKLRDGKEQTIYYHKILEAKLVVGPLVLSIGTEFIENEDKHVTKQDCEQRAAKRLMERLKKEYPRLPVCLQGDGLNRQKNGIYDIEHLNSHNSCALKNHYLLTQIAEILMQLYLSWNPYARKLKQSIKNTSSKLLVSLTEHSISSEDVKYIEMHTKIHLSG